MSARIIATWTRREDGGGFSSCSCATFASTGACAHAAYAHDLARVRGSVAATYVEDNEHDVVIVPINPPRGGRS